jgi:hypothetical protein
LGSVVSFDLSTAQKLTQNRKEAGALGLRQGDWVIGPWKLERLPARQGELAAEGNAENFRNLRKISRKALKFPEILSRFGTIFILSENSARNFRKVCYRFQNDSSEKTDASADGVDGCPSIRDFESFFPIGDQLHLSQRD